MQHAPHARRKRRPPSSTSARLPASTSLSSCTNILRQPTTSITRPAHTQVGQLRQLPGVGDTMCVRLGGSQIVTLLDLARVPSARVDTITGRKHPFGHGARICRRHDVPSPPLCRCMVCGREFLFPSHFHSTGRYKKSS